MTANPSTMFAFAFSVTAPIFLMVILGALLKAGRIIDAAFINTASRLVFLIGLPTLLFISCATTDLTQSTDGRLLVVMAVMTLLVFFLAQITAGYHVQQRRDSGVFVQGAFRGNLVITGLAFCANAYGAQGLAIAALPVAMTVVIYNVLSVYTLTRSLDNDGGSPLKKILIGIIRNPLIIAISAGFIVNITGAPLPQLLLDSGSYLGQMVLPLALIGIGGSLDFKHLRRFDCAAFSASLWKLIISPLIACLLALALQVRDENLAVLFLLAASPTATVSFVMVQAMGGNARLAAHIVALTTLGSIFTVTAGLWVLQQMGWV